MTIYAADLHMKSICVMPGELKFPGPDEVALPDDVELLLIEVPSAKMFGEDDGSEYNRTRWALAAIHYATLLHLRYPVLVASSSEWTRGYSVELRQEVSKAKGSNIHLRDASAMLWFHANHPDPWVPLPAFVHAL